MNARADRRVIEAGDSALLLQIGPSGSSGRVTPFDADVNREAIGVAESIRRTPGAGVRDVISTYRSVAVFFDPLEADVDNLRATLKSCEPIEHAGQAARRVDVPVMYGGQDGPDLDDVASFAGCDAAAVIERHLSRTYRVFMVGFLPGFPYMAAVDPSIAAPRRPTPRVSVPSGSVGIAGQQTGIYPSDSPGGWQIIGRTPLTLFDPDRTPPALFAPGDMVRFTQATPNVLSPTQTPGTNSGPGTKHQAQGTASITVLRPGLMSSIQDRGRWGYAHLGVPPAGPMDPAAHSRANWIVGNSDAAATIEATLVGPELRCEEAVRIAIAGADLSAELDGVPINPDAPAECAPGSVLRFGSRKSGGRAYISFAGGIDVPSVLGSRATHVQSGMGGLDGRLLRAGDRLSIGAADATAVTPVGRTLSGPPGEPNRAASLGAGEARPTRGRSGVVRGGARLRVIRGPQADYFDDVAFDRLQRSRFVISPQSNRMGYRLSGDRIPVLSAGGMMSDAVFTGAIQVPPSGDPILLMADRQTTGGYPQIAVLISADMPVAGQLLPGDWIKFELCTRADAIAALREQRHSNGTD